MHSNKIDQLEENIHSHIFLFSTDRRRPVGGGTIPGFNTRFCGQELRHVTTYKLIFFYHFIIILYLKANNEDKILYSKNSLIIFLSLIDEASDLES